MRWTASRGRCGRTRTAPASIWRCRGRCWRRWPTPHSSSGSTASSTAARCCGICRTHGSSTFSAPPTTTPVLPLIPAVDRAEQLLRWHGVANLLFNRCEFAGMWPPEMGFCPELVPLIRRLGYRYVLVDSVHVAPVTPMRWDELRYRPHVTRYRGQEMVVVVRDRELSDAQESGMDADWFVREVRDRTRRCDFTPLVTTCTDGDNGGWFRNTTAGSNFWTGFYTELLDRSRRGDSGGIRPVFIHDYLAEHPPVGEVRIHAGAWNTGWHDGVGFTQWTGSSEQRAALARVYEVSERVHEARWRADGARPELAEALRHVLRAETSCSFFWGSAWLGRCERDLERALELVATAGVELG
ncbi:hypothetical protein [Kutzneria sp. 744]|uniref:hypothetical protein n=1 Tax=Kutzneria sp. (strain 744) TaxID=345341 RepID=UPI0021015BF1|nr:hypothetical protein [Kutzneria sp. 744]